MNRSLENARPLNIQQWSNHQEVDYAVDTIFDEIMGLGEIQRVHERLKDCLKVVLLDLFACHLSDPKQFIRFSRDTNSYRTDQYNLLQIKPERLRNIVDSLEKLGYLTLKIGYQTNSKGSPSRKARQSRMRATSKLTQHFASFNVSAPMLIKHPKSETILLKDSSKKLIGFTDTPDTQKWREALKSINGLLSKTLINLYMSDDELMKMNRRLAGGCDGEEGEDDEIPRRAIDFTQKSLCRIFNNSSFKDGGRLYGGWWQGVPREHRHRIRINRMNTVEVDFSAMHLNLIYWLEDLSVPDDPYTLPGFPKATREVVKKCLLTMINAKNRIAAMKSIGDRIKGTKISLPRGRREKGYSIKRHPF